MLSGRERLPKGRRLRFGRRPRPGYTAFYANVAIKLDHFNENASRLKETRLL